MAFSTCAMVAGLIPNLINGASDFEGLNDATILPASATIVTFMSAGCSMIVAKLAAMGFNPPSQGGALWDYLGMIEANFAAWQCELARSSPRVAKGERSRADDYRKAYEAALRQLEKMDLTMLGFTPKYSSGAGWYAGGTSKAEKDSVESNTDRTLARFKRDKFANREAPDYSADDEQER